MCNEKGNTPKLGNNPSNLSQGKTPRYGVYPKYIYMSTYLDNSLVNAAVGKYRFVVFPGEELELL